MRVCAAVVVAGVCLSIYTPANLKLNPPDSHDRPYAGFRFAFGL